MGAKAEVFEVMDELARSGAAILMVSSEMAELLQVADRILVMRQGRITGELPRPHHPGRDHALRRGGSRGRMTARMMQRLLPFLSLIVLFVALAIASPHFLTDTNLSSVVRQTAVINIMSLGMTIDHHRRRHRSFGRRDPGHGRCARHDGAGTRRIRFPSAFCIGVLTGLLWGLATAC